MVRERIRTQHRLWMVGLLYFLQNDEAVPAACRDEARSWGFARDEFKDNHYFPGQLYVREARRMDGVYVYSQKDCEKAPGDARAVWQKESIAMGDYGPNCHGTGHQGTRFGGTHSGEFYRSVAPYQIPYGALVPKNVDNLLVPGAVSATHVGYCSLRFEPIWMTMGEAAGHAVHLANAARSSVQKVEVKALQARLHRAGSATIYVSDVLPGHPDFTAVQWWGANGGLHGLSGPPVEMLGKKIVGQYFEAFPMHSVELDKTLDAELADRWMSVFSNCLVGAALPPKADGKLTRGEWIRAAWKLSSQSDRGQ